MMKLQNWNDTIVALATPPGVGALGIIRLSGADAILIINELFIAKDLTKTASHTLHVGWLEHEGNRLDEVVVSIFKAPRSYTGENVVEISCHGSAYIHQEVINACIHKGARIAAPGEFTQRAFLQGKMDLTQAEAVADVIASSTAAAHLASLNQMRGGFSTLLKELREELIKFTALIELELDFATEDVEFADRTQLSRLLHQISVTVHNLIGSFSLGNVIKNGVQVAIIGKPNAGKSTLLNTLLNENRAIVSPIAGTTRDTVEEILNIEGILFRLIDTAGLRQSTDAIETIGVEKSMEKMRQADLIIYLFDVLSENPEALQETCQMMLAEGKQYLLVGNKCDKEDVVSQKKYADFDWISISAKENKRIDELKRQMVKKIVSGNINSQSTIITNTRHLASLSEVAKCLNEIEQGVHQNLSGDLLTIDIRRCLHYLGSITGEVEIDRDILGAIFSKFCIGK